MAEQMKVDEQNEIKIIIDKYEKGREKILDIIDDWEDPTNEIYQVTDRYGFVHDDKLPEKLSKYENQIREIEMKRREKWRKMLVNWDVYKEKKFDKLRERVFKGIPNAVRGNAWILLLDVPKIKKEQEGRYEEMYILGKQYSKEIRQIDLDVNRTFRNNEMFRERYNTKQQELFRVLVAYSVYNSEIGYCQGMSQIVALLLMFTSEEDSFWALDRLMSDTKYAMHGFFIPNFPKLQRFVKHHDLVLRKFLKPVYKHFQKLDIESTLYTLKWFFQCFLDRVPFSLTLRLWDCFMVDGERILICMSYTLLKLHRKTILKKGIDELIPFLQIDLEKDFGYHDDEAIHELQKSINELHKNKMDVPSKTLIELEIPTKPFGLIMQKDETCSLMNDDRSIVDSIHLKSFAENEASTANTSRTSSATDLDDYKEDLLNEDLINVRKLSVYDNVELDESFMAAKKLNLIKSSNDTLKNIDENINGNNENLENKFKLISNNQSIKNLDKILDEEIKSLEKVLSKENSKINVQNENIKKSPKEEKPLTKNILNSSLDSKQIKKKNSFKDKFLRRKSSIPRIKKVDNEINNKSNQSFNKEIETEQNFKNQVNSTPKRTSLIPRLSSSSFKNSSFKSKNSSIEIRKLSFNKNNSNSNNLNNVNDFKKDDSNLDNELNLRKSIDSTKVRIYVPYAKLSNHNDNSNLSLNSINQFKNKNSKETDMNKITINVNQKYRNDTSSNIETINIKNYLSTIDT